ncbi:SDR family NAD(P)-dependent oxidoreductase [Micromonospora wenchangensis]
MTGQRVALVTGASSGIGAAIARELGRWPDLRLVLLARRTDRLRALAAELPSADVIGADLTSPDAPRQILDRLDAGPRRLDILVNNAGAHFGGTFAATGWENVRRSLDLNFAAHVRLTESVLPLLRASTGTVVNVASVAGRIGLAGSGAYSAAKFALCGWSEALHAEERPHGVHVALVLPGFVATEGFTYPTRRASRSGRLLVSTDRTVATAIGQVVRRRTAERYVPRPWWLLAASRRALPGLHRRATPTIET